MRYDHVGFMLSNGSQIQMSGHHDDNEVYMTKNVTDDPMFKSQALKKITLPKTVSIPTTNIFPDVQNCSGFVGAVLAQNGLPKLNAQYFNNLFKR
jgi:L-ribulose-5-phosphate 3-epimerase UlaE